jgi:hypothetical protein
VARLSDRNILIKKSKILDLLDQINDRIVVRFFDVDSDKLLDKKIQVLSDLVSGKKPAEIDGYYLILENYPDRDQHWD